MVVGAPVSAPESVDTLVPVESAGSAVLREDPEHPVSRGAEVGADLRERLVGHLRALLLELRPDGAEIVHRGVARAVASA